jgi:hypothetical protein
MPLIWALLSAGATLAAEGMITVLEAPMFRTPDAGSPVVQYVGKGDTVFLHGAVLDRDLSATVDSTKVQRARERLAPLEHDPLYRGMPTERSHPDFVLTKDRQGRDAWLLRRHVHVWYEDEREGAQSDVRPDPTDYRLLEPLPAAYPFDKRALGRGLMLLGLGNPSTVSYPYKEAVAAEGYGYQYELSTHLTRLRSRDPLERWQWGGLFLVRTSQSEYVLQTRRAKERWLRLGVGPMMSYDLYRAEKQRLTLWGATLLYPFNTAQISQEEPGIAEDRRRFWGWSMSARAGAHWQRFNVLPDTDLVLGMWGEAGPASQMRSLKSAKMPTWWRAGGKGDGFDTGVTANFGGQIGIQSSY